MHSLIILVAFMALHKNCLVFCESCILETVNRVFRVTSSYAFLRHIKTEQECINTCMEDGKCDNVGWFFNNSYGEWHCLLNNINFGEPPITYPWLGATVYKCRGSCQYEGKSYKPGDTFYTDDCKQMCQCRLDGVKCSPFTCPPSRKALSKICFVKVLINYTSPIDASFKCSCPIFRCAAPERKYINANPSSTSHIHCEQSTLSWIFNNSDITSFSDSKYGRNLTTLFIHDVNENDEGDYRCGSDLNVYQLVIVKQKEPSTQYSMTSNGNQNHSNHLMLLWSMLFIIIVLFPNRY
eukprot:TCONS_00065401-protein